MQLLDDIAHKIHVMRTPGAVMPNSTCHTVRQRLVDHRNRQHTMFPRVDVMMLFHHAPAMETVYYNVQILAFGVVADDRLCISIL